MSGCIWFKFLIQILLKNDWTGIATFIKPHLVRMRIATPLKDEVCSTERSELCFLISISRFLLWRSAKRDTAAAAADTKRRERLVPPPCQCWAKEIGEFSGSAASECWAGRQEYHYERRSAIHTSVSEAATERAYSYPTAVNIPLTVHTFCTRLSARWRPLPLL